MSARVAPSAGASSRSFRVGCILFSSSLAQTNRSIGFLTQASLSIRGTATGEGSGCTLQRSVSRNRSADTLQRDNPVPQQKIRRWLAFLKASEGYSCPVQASILPRDCPDPAESCPLIRMQSRQSGTPHRGQPFPSQREGILRMDDSKCLGIQPTILYRRSRHAIHEAFSSRL